MRIVAGQFRGRRLHAPKDVKIRPTSDRVREAIFNILAPDLSTESHVLDLFAGTGALGLEALSRGAVRAVFVDQSREAVLLIRSNIALCNAQDRTEVIQGTVQTAVRKLSGQEGLFHLIFMDPPYGKGQIESALLLVGGVARPSAIVIAEHHVKEDPPDQVGEWQRAQARRYGDTVVSFYVKSIPAETLDEIPMR